MATYTDETKLQHKAFVRRQLALNPHLSVYSIIAGIKEQEGLELSFPYVKRLAEDLKEEYTHYYNKETKESVTGQFEEICSFVVGRLRGILAEEKAVYDKEGNLKYKVISQKNRIMALNSIVSAYEKLNKLKMDLGLLDRKLGELKIGDERVIKVLNEIRTIRQLRENGITTSEQLKTHLVGLGTQPDLIEGETG